MVRYRPSKPTDLERLVLGNLEAVCDDAGVQALLDVAVRLLQELAHQEHHRCCAVAADIILRRRGARNHDGRGVLYLHLAEEDIAVFCQFDLSCVVSGPQSFTVSCPIRT
jgi:hypothetical protein